MGKVWCLDIKESDAPDTKSVKTSDQRIIPLHPFLVDDLYFIGYVEEIKEQGHKRVFPKLTNVRNRWGHYVGKRFTEFRKNCGIEAQPRKKVFHSFRHTLIDNLKQTGAKEKHMKEFVGHKGRGDITWDLYGKQFKPLVLMDEVVLKLNYELDMNHLKSSKWVANQLAG